MQPAPTLRRCDMRRMSWRTRVNSREYSVLPGGDSPPPPACASPFLPEAYILARYWGTLAAVAVLGICLTSLAALGSACYGVPGGKVNSQSFSFLCFTFVQSPCGSGYDSNIINWIAQ